MPGTKRLLSPRGLGALAIVAATSIFWWRFNAEPRLAGQFVFMDLVNYYHPMAQLAAERLRALELPLWNPTACGGLPLLATLQVGVFYPGNWPAAWFGVEAVQSWLLAIECLLGGGFAAWAFRALGATVPAATHGGILFVFACLIGQTQFTAPVHTIVWIPWLVLCVARLAKGGGLRWWLGLVAGTALQLFAGFPQFALLSFYLVTGFAVVSLFEAARSDGRAVVPRCAAIFSAVLLGAGIAAIQLLPSLELVGQSARATPLDAEAVHYIGTTPILGDFLRNAVDPSARRLTFDFGPGAGYLGVAALFLVPLGVGAGWRQPSTWLWVAGGGLALLLSDGYRGSSSFLYELYAQTPGGAAFRTPERFRLLFFFSAIALSVRGLDELAGGFSALRTDFASRVLPIGVGAAVAGIALAAAVLGPGGVGWRVAVVATLILVVLLRPEHRGARLSAAVGVLVFSILDLALAVGPYGLMRGLPGAYAEPAFTRFVSPGGNEIGAAGVARLREEAGFDRVELYRFMPKLGAGDLGGLQRPTCFEPLVPRAWAEFLEVVADSQGSGLANVDPRTTPVFYDVASVARIVVPGQDGTPRIVENTDASPRAYLVDRFQVGQHEEILERIARGDVDLAGEVWLEARPALPAPRPGSAGFAPGRARITEYRPERVRVAVEADRDALLILTDVHYPGWAAEVDGQPVEILRANGLFRAVVIASGSREVIFSYAPVSVRRGMAVSGLSGLAVLLAALVWRRRA